MGPPWGAEKAAEAPRAHGPGTEVRPVHPGGGALRKERPRSWCRGCRRCCGDNKGHTHSNRAPRGPRHTGGAPSMAAAPGQTPSPRDLTARLTPHLRNGATVRGALSLGRLWDPVTPPRAVLTGPRRALAVTSILGARALKRRPYGKPPGWASGFVCKHASLTEGNAPPAHFLSVSHEEGPASGPDSCPHTSQQSQPPPRLRLQDRVTPAPSSQAAKRGRTRTRRAFCKHLRMRYTGGAR